jgi:hypothetical protein
MSPSEQEIDRLLTEAHDVAWNCGRSDLTVPIVRAICLLRRLAPPRPAYRLDDAEFDQQAELDEQQITLKDLSAWRNA